MDKRLRVLNVEDSERDAALLSRHLTSAGYDLIHERVDNAVAMKASLDSEEWDIILCDYSMPQFDALAALNVLKTSGLDIPLIIISGTVGEDVAVQAMRSGANDYLMKDNLARLGPTIERELHDAENRRVQRETLAALKASEAEMRALFQAMNDVILVLDSEGRHLKVAPTSPTQYYKQNVHRIGKTVHEIFRAGVADLILRNVKRSLDEARTLHVEYALVIDGQDVWFDATVTPMTEETVMWVAREVNERKRSQNERRIIFDIIQGVVTTPNLDEFLKLVHRSISELVYAENCFVMLHDPVTDMVSFEFWTDKHDPVPPPGPAGKGFGAYILRTGHPLLITEESKKRITDGGEADQVGSFSPSWLGVPLRTPDRTIGVLVIQHYEVKNAYDQRDLEFLSSVGDQIALAIERKRAEEALTESEVRYRELVENALDIIYTADLDGNYTSVNRATEKITAYTTKEILTMNMAQLADPESLEKAREMTAAKLSGQEVTVYELEILAKDGHRVAVEINSRLVFENGIPVGVQGIARDITERKQQEEARRASEQKYHDIFNLAPVGIYRSLRDGTLLTANNALAEILGYESTDELLNVNITDLYFNQDERESLIAEYIDIGRVFDLEVQWKRKDGSAIWIQLTSRQIAESERGQECFEGFVRDITETKQMNEALRESESRLRTIIDTEPECVKLLDRDGSLLEMNPAGLRMVEADSFEEVASQCIFGLIAEKDRQAFRDLTEGVFRGESGMLEFQIRGLKGTQRVLDTHASPLRDATGNITALLGIARDVTERKQAERALGESNEKFQQLAENITDAFWIRSPDLSEVQYVSPAFEKIWGRSVESLYADPHQWSDFILPEDRQSVIEGFDALTRDKKNLDIEYRIVRPDGGIRWVRVRGFPVMDGDGIVIRHAGIVTDITERKQTDEAIRESEERFSGAFMYAPIGVALVAPDGRWLKVNRALCELVGYTEAELLQMTFQDITHPDDLEADLASVNAVIAGEINSYQMEKRCVHKLGHFVSILLNVSLVRGARGQPSYFISQIQDMTARKELEEQFRQSQKMEAVGVLAGGIAHDFNNLLTAINGYSDLTLRKMAQDDPLRRNIVEVKEAGLRAAELTGQLLAFSRKQILTSAVINLNSVISNIEKMLSRIIKESIDLRVALEPELGNIKADRGRIEQVIMNLAINARDAMPHGGTLTIETKNVYLGDDYVAQHINVSPGEFIKLTVTDTGEGMGAETQSHIFEPFFTTKEVGKGTGLGLSTVYGIVKQSGGDIMVYSEPGHGTTFKIYLPQVEGSAEKPKWVGDREEKILGTETILLVEDEKVVRTLVREILGDNGYSVLDAASGKEALAICKSYSETIDMLLTDVIMPKMNGGELRDRIVELRPDIKVLFMSGYTDDSVAHRGIFDSDIDFIEKPFTPDGLARKVREVLEV